MVKHVVKGYFRPEQGRSQGEKVLEPQRVWGLGDFNGVSRAPAPKCRALPIELHPDIEFLWSADCGRSCGQRGFLGQADELPYSRKRRCFKGFLASPAPIADRRGSAPKVGALPNALRMPARFNYLTGSIFHNAPCKWSDTTQ